ncbi:MAG: hypothetical protein R3C14_37365 [Caldilineaceae bacterium]
MAHMELTKHEAGLLQEILVYYLSELRMEIADTDDQKFRENLKEKEEDIKKLLTRCEQLFE